MLCRRGGGCLSWIVNTTQPVYTKQLAKGVDVVRFVSQLITPLTAGVNITLCK